jgi:hypothetical protein
VKKLKSTLTKDIRSARKIFKENKLKNTQILRQVIGSIRILITENDMISSISWTQYTPYFNDGNTCEFQVNGVEIGLTELGVEFMNNNTVKNYAEQWATDETYSLYYVKQELEGAVDVLTFDSVTNTISLIKTLEKVDDFLLDSTDELRIAFGDHSRVVVDTGGIAVEMYDHD